MIFSPERVELDHLPAVANVTFAWNEIAPFAVEIDKGEVDQPVDDQHPHHREMPVPRAGEPPSKSENLGNRFVLEWIAAEHLAFPRKRGIGVEDLQAAADHDDDGNDIHPMGDTHDPVMTLSALGLCWRVGRRHTCL